MSDNVSASEDTIDIQPMSIDQFAGAIVLILGAIGSLLLVVWQSRCACKFRIGCSDKCYIFDCAREPPPVEDAEDEGEGEEAVRPQQPVGQQPPVDDDDADADPPNP